MEVITVRIILSNKEDYEGLKSFLFMNKVGYSGYPGRLELVTESYHDRIVQNYICMNFTLKSVEV